MAETQIKSDLTDKGSRLDSFLCQKLEELSRNSIQNIIEVGGVSLNGKVLKKNYKLDGGETFSVDIPELKTVEITAENIPIDIIYEDEDIVVINKPRGMVVHPAVGNWSGTLVNALMYHCGDSLSGINGEIRPGIVHRIDKDTSGLLVVAKNDKAHQNLAEQMKQHTAGRIYSAVVIGNIRDDLGTIHKPVGRHKTERKKMAVVEGGREAVTHFKTLERYPGYTYMSFELETGRTHQIRVHMASIGHPILGDSLYGAGQNKWNFSGQCLHAGVLKLTHPITGEEMTFTAPLPQYFEEILMKLRKI